jgi:hypothetical protein
LTKKERDLIEAIGNELSADGSDNAERVKKYIQEITTGVKAVSA